MLAENPDTGEKGYYPITYTTHHLATDGLVLITIGSVSTNENKPAELFVASGIAGASTLGSASGSSSGSGPGSVTSSETIKATPQHPFWVPGRGWVNAGDLQPGDQLLSSDGRSLTVEATEVVSEQSQVYNFTVDQFHTYFVGRQQALVHNIECTKVTYGDTDLSKAAIQYRRENKIRGTRNVAVFEVDLGRVQFRITRASENNRHAERIIADELDALGIDMDKVRKISIYTELEPCTIKSPNCMKFLGSRFPKAEVTYSFSYGDPASRKQGVKDLEKAVKKYVEP